MLSDHLPFDTKHLCREGGQVGKEWTIHNFENINDNFENIFENINANFENIFENINANFEKNFENINDDIEKNLDNIPEHQETVLAAYDDFPLVDCRA